MTSAKPLPAPHRTLLVVLATIPSFDCLVNQLNNAFQISFGPLSLLQVLRGDVVVVFMVVTAWSLVRDPSGVRRIPLPAVAALLLIGMAITKEFVLTGALWMPSVGDYGQMTHWVMFWIMVSVLCRESGQAEIILWGLGIGATLTALSVVLGLVFGGLNYYEEDAVRSSAGWFDTSKYITGVLVCGGITLLYLGRRSKSWIFPLLAGICFVACLITYARAGAVALCAVLIWLPLWSVIFGRREQRQWLNRFLILAFAAGLLAPVFVKPDTLFVRWGDLQDSDKAGSGRATFWKVAVDGYVEATPAQQGLGYGYSAMSDMLFLNYGRISSIPTTTCSTCFWSAVLPERRGCCALIGALAWRVFRSSLFTVEGAAGAAILLTYLLHGQFIGQLWSTDAMTYYVLSLTCLHILGRPATAELRVRPHSDTEEYSRTLAPA